MFRIYTSFGYDVHTLTEYEGTYETVGQAMVALEAQQPLDNIGYIYNAESFEVEFLIGIAYGEIDYIETLKLTSRDSMIESLKNVLTEIERRNV